MRGTCGRSLQVDQKKGAAAASSSSTSAVPLLHGRGGSRPCLPREQINEERRKPSLASTSAPWLTSACSPSVAGLSPHLVVSPGKGSGLMRRPPALRSW